jgi:hypothetical protein
MGKREAGGWRGVGRGGIEVLMYQDWMIGVMAKISGKR